MLLYHPAYDSYHCTFRLLRLLKSLPKTAHGLEKIRILDFFLLYPTLLLEITLPNEARKYRKQLEELDKPYEELGDKYKIFLQMESYQLSSLRSLASWGIIDPKEFKEKKIMLTNKKLPKNLLNLIQETNREDSVLMELLINHISPIELYGEKGLKARTKLSGYKYDPK